MNQMGLKRIAIIGGGPGGYVAAIRGAQLGAKVTLIERDRIGGTCLNRGCIPTKTLLHDAKFLRSFKRSPLFKIEQFHSSGLLPIMMDRKERVVQELVKGIELILHSYGVRVIHGDAHLLSSKRVRIFENGKEKEDLEVDAVLLAMGSTSKALPHVVPDGERIITSNEALRLREIPKEMVIVGGGYIGIELATFFNTLGSKVTLIEILENILSGFEEELVRNLRRLLEKDGIQIFTNSSVEETESLEKELVVKVITPKGKVEIHCEKLLLAVGRVPNIGFDLTQKGVERTSQGIKVDSYMETTLKDVYAIGDVVGGMRLAPLAMEQGIIAIENALGFKREWKDPLLPLCLFSNPEIASVGLTEKEAKAKGTIKIGRFPFRSNPKAVLSGEPEGWIKVIVSEEEGKILGIHILGSEANLLASLGLTMIGEKLKEFTRFIQAHPTIVEGLKEACLDVEGVAIHLPKSIRHKT
ncbi:MAG: dihydrolipoyl dehydrogenase [Thermodesulfobacteriota bacterium]